MNGEFFFRRIDEPESHRLPSLAKKAVAFLTEDVRLLRDDLAMRKVFEIAETLRRFPTSLPDPGVAWASILAEEVGRSLSRTDGGASALTAKGVGLVLVDGETYAERWQAVSDWLQRLRIARTFADADPSPATKEGVAA